MNSDDLKNSLEGLFSGLDSTQGEEEKSQLANQIRGEKPAALSPKSSGGEKQKVDEIPPHPLTLSEKNLSRPQPARCPYLGLTTDRDSRFSYPEAAHRCFVTHKESSVSLDHQARFCLAEYSDCSRFVEPSADLRSSHPIPISSSARTSTPHAGKTIPWSTIILGTVGLLVGLLIISGVFYFSSESSEGLPVTEPAVLKIPTFTPTLTPTVKKVVELTPTSVPVASLVTPTPTSLLESRVYELSPEIGAVGWVGSGESRANYFGDSYLYSGLFEGQIYLGAFQINLGSIPRGAPILSATIYMTGLRDDRLAVKSDRSTAGGVWSLRLLDPRVDENWSKQNYQSLFSATVLDTLNPILSDRDLAVDQTNVFEFPPDLIKLLEQRILDDEDPRVSFRVDGPVVGPDNLFAWDTGFGPESQGSKVILALNVSQPPATVPSYKYVVVTSTPTPENIATAAAVVLQMTADATRIGTATPAPPNMATATIIPDYLIITPTPTPENGATAQAMADYATAIALTTGTPPPIPTNAVTATPSATPSATPVPNYVIITSTPLPDTVFAAATLSAVATAQARQFGPATPLPAGWVTPIVVTSTPTPANVATAQAWAAGATAVAFTTGTPTPVPLNVVTATPTPVFDIVPFVLPPLPTRAPSAILPIPAALLDKILFKSDREVYGEGETLSVEEYENLTGLLSPPPGSLVLAPDPNTGETRQYIIRPPTDVYVFDPNTGQLGRLTEPWPYDVAWERDAYSADMAYKTYTKKLLWTNVEVVIGTSETGREITERRPTDVLAVHFYDFKYKQEAIVTRMGAGVAYDPVWSPVSNQIAFVSTESGNDEIWIINHDGTDPRQITHNTWEWDKSPTWSPDGKQIVFMSNRTGNQQLWIMNADGSDQRLLLGWDNWTPYNDWGPVWVKYLNPPPQQSE